VPSVPTPYPNGDGALAGGEVRLWEANKQAGSAIGLTRDGLAVKTRPEMPPASGERRTSGSAVAGARISERRGTELNSVWHG
jgi:hypothetical protein